MTEQERFTVVGIRQEERSQPQEKGWRNLPWVSLALLCAILLGCLGAGIISSKEPSYLDLANCAHPPDGAFFFGTDTLGRDIFSCIWHGGRVSLSVGLLSAMASTLIALAYGSLSGLAPAWLDALLMRAVELFLSVPSLLVVLFLQALLGGANVLSLSLVIGATGWCPMAKVIRTQVGQLRSSEHVLAAKCMGGGFLHILRWHLAPNFLPSILFMVVMSVRSAMVTESTLSFLGMGLPLEVISWGSMLSLAENAFMSQAWWVVVIPGGFLVTLLMCVTSLGNWLQERLERKARNL